MSGTSTAAPFGALIVSVAVSPAESPILVMPAALERAITREGAPYHGSQKAGAQRSSRALHVPFRA